MCLLTDRGILMTKGSGHGGVLGHGNEVQLWASFEWYFIMVKTDVLVYPKNEANPSREFQELNRKRVIHSARRSPLTS